MPRAFAELERQVAAAGLAQRGALTLTEAERQGPLAAIRSVVLLGWVGGEQWPHFAASPEAADGRPHPLDRWSRRVVTALAEEFAATPLFPFEGPPYWPFQAWARAAEPVAPSPMGLFIHPVYGLWHNYRGALGFAEDAARDFPAAAASPCVGCARPCLSSCPVGAFGPAGFDVGACAAWLRDARGADCLTSGCRARRACPVGTRYTQGPEQAQFHMQAFLAART